MSDAGASEGGCRCGQVRFTVTGDPLMTMACHCRGCQQMTASAYSVSAIYPADQFSVVAGEPIAGALRGPHRHLYCPNCLSWVFTRPEGVDDFVNIRSTLLDQPPLDRPFIEMATAEALPWARLGSPHSFAGFPSNDQFPALVGAFVTARMSHQGA